MFTTAFAPMSTRSPITTGSLSTAGCRPGADNYRLAPQCVEMCTPELMSHPLPMVRPPEPSMTVKAPIQVPSPTVGVATTQACAL